ncbi:proprotein convertase P-domain-containing protein [Streptomyces sp. NPDC051020]|uniref:proprotein convertase P-domain-containing protein n=1 Tax=Streptomyces sp. NPDC051020 TaxID=3155409 RepID=UPI0034163C6F
MKRAIRAVVAAAAATTLFTAIPADAGPLPRTGTAAAASAASAGHHDPVDPRVRDKAKGGTVVRVNVVTETRTDLPEAATAGKKAQSFDKLPLVTLKVDKNGLDKLATQPGVVSVTEDVPVPPTLNESVPLIGGDKAIAAGKTGSGVSVAILDTGVATHHPFLSNRVKTEACYSVNDATYAATSLCPDGTMEQQGTGSADADAGVCATLGTACEHGTHVAGIAAGDGNGLTGAPHYGVAPGADLIALQVFSKIDSEDYCGVGAAPCVLSFTSSQIKALEKVLALKNAGTNVIAANLSLGAGRWTSACDTDPRKLIIDSLFGSGVATVVAAGNNGYPDAVSAPGCVASAVTVGASTEDDQPATFSNLGPLLDYFAPGTNITSSLPGGAYGVKNGTSMATPHVTGVLAILHQAFRTENLTALLARLTTTGKPITYTGGTTRRIDVGQAIGGTAPDPEPDAKPRPTTITNDKDYAIPDPGILQAPITADGVPGNASYTTKVSVAITHEYIGDLRIDILTPDGQAYPLRPLNSTEAGTSINTTYTVDVHTATAGGTWKLLVEDVGTGRRGTLTSWSLTFANSFEQRGSYAIPDPGTLTSQLTVANMPGNAPSTLRVFVGGTHDWRGDLQIDLLAPDGRTYPIKSSSPTENGGNLSSVYVVDASLSPANGTWKLLVQDTSTGSRGFLTIWSLTFTSLENQTVLSVPDNGSAVDSPVNLSSTTGITGNASKGTKVHVEATHARRGDLKIELLDPNGKVYLVKAASTTDTGINIKRTYTVDTSTSPMLGTWKLHVTDVTTGTTGTIDDWTLTF